MSRAEEILSFKRYLDFGLYNGDLTEDESEALYKVLLDAAEALRKQTPKRLVYRGKMLMELKQYDCPSCGKGGFLSSCSKYCNECGQALLWVE